ncbi:hypothetical protein ACS0TY_016112 [Phlomoides rotata]
MGQIQYSEKYFDDTYEYRHVVLPSEVSKLLPKNRLLSEGNSIDLVQRSAGQSLRVSLLLPEVLKNSFKVVDGPPSSAAGNPFHTICLLFTMVVCVSVLHKL